MKTYPFLLLAIVFASCSTSVKTYCKLSRDFPDRTRFYRDFSVFGLQGVGDISCEEATQRGRFIFMTYHKDSLDLVTIKPYQNSNRKFYIQRKRTSSKPLYMTDILRYLVPGGKNFDTILVSNSSQFIIYRQIKLQARTDRALNEYFIWDKKSANQVEFYYYTMTGGNYLNPANYGSNGRLNYKIEYTLTNGVLVTKKTHQRLPYAEITEKNERFESEFDQIFLNSF